MNLLFEAFKFVKFRKRISMTHWKKLPGQAGWWFPIPERGVNLLFRGYSVCQVSQEDFNDSSRCVHTWHVHIINLNFDRFLNRLSFWKLTCCNTKMSDRSKVTRKWCILGQKNNDDLAPAHETLCWNKELLTWSFSEKNNEHNLNILCR